MLVCKVKLLCARFQYTISAPTPAGSVSDRSRQPEFAVADGGGSNGSWARLWKVAVQRMADATGLKIAQSCKSNFLTTAYGRILDLAKEHNVRVMDRLSVDREYAAFCSPAQIAAIDRFLQGNGILLPFLNNVDKNAILEEKTTVK
jgi:hypothetical protein